MAEQNQKTGLGAKPASIGKIDPIKMAAPTVQRAEQKQEIVSDAPKQKKSGRPFSALGRRPEGMEEDAGTNRVKRTFFWLAGTLTCAVLFWLNVGTLDIVSMTMGEVIPSSQVKTIQHLEGGIVLEIKVREGQKVKQGQSLVVLEKTASSADVAEAKLRLDAITVDIARLEAEANEATEVMFDQALLQNSPDLVQQAIERFRARKEAVQAKVISQGQTIRQRRKEIEEITARIENRKGQLKLQSEQVKISEELLRDELTSRYLHLDLLKKAGELRGGIKQDQVNRARAQAALEEAESELNTIRANQLNEVRQELDKARLEQSELRERSKKFADSLRRTELRAPVHGIIKTLYVATVGGVIRPGDPVVDIVPGGDRLVIESRLPTQDIGYIQPGQSAIVKLTSADAAKFGDLDGVVTHISADTLLSQDGAPYYKVRVETEQSFFEKGGQRYQLYPGMQVMANIRTGNRTVFEYLFEPMLVGFRGAMQER